MSEWFPPDIISRTRHEGYLSCTRVEDAGDVSLSYLCLRSLESSLGKGLASLSLQGLPLGLAEKIYRYVAERGSRMAQMEVSRALAPLLSRTVICLDFTNSETEHQSSCSGGSSCGYSNGFIGESALLELANGCGMGLIHLDLGGCRLVKNAGVLAVLARCQNLSSLGLSGLDGVSDQALYLIPHQIPYLTKLNLAGLSGITASGIAYLSFLPSLEHLNLARCCQIGDEAAAALGRGNCSDSLRWLDLSGTATTDDGVSSLHHTKLLEFISLSSTTVSLALVNALARDLNLPAALPDAPKMHARSNRTLLMGSRWSRRQSGFAPRRLPHSTRNTAGSLRYGHGTSKRGWEGGPSKLLRIGTGVGVGDCQVGGSRKRPVLAGEPVVQKVQVGFGDGEGGDGGGEGGDGGGGGRVGYGGRELLVELVNGIVRLWPAVPVR